MISEYFVYAIAVFTRHVLIDADFRFSFPELQKHYAAVQALALGEDVLEFDEKKDSTLPDADGFARDDVKVIQPES